MTGVQTCALPIYISYNANWILIIGYVSKKRHVFFFVIVTLSNGGEINNVKQSLFKILKMSPKMILVRSINMFKEINEKIK